MVPYTIPAVRLPDGKYAMGSSVISQKIEALYPEPMVHLDSPLQAEVQRALNKVMMRLAPVLVPRMPRETLSGVSIQYHREAREKTFGMSLEEFEDRFGGDAAWQRAIPFLRQLAEILRANSDGPFCQGAVPTYSDFLIVAFLEWCVCLRGPIFDRVVDIDPVFSTVYMACKPWLARNNYWTGIPSHWVVADNSKVRVKFQVRHRCRMPEMREKTKEIHCATW